MTSGNDGTVLERGRIPLYLQLAQILRSQIESGEYKAGDVLPTEDQVSKTYRVSLITVRQARHLLAEEGLILKYSGKGTFIAECSSRGAYLAASTIDDLIFAGHVHETRRKCISRKVLRADARTAELLHVPPGGRVLEVQSMMYIEDCPYGHTCSRIPFSLGRRIPEKRLSEKPLILLLGEICKTQVDQVDELTMASRGEDPIAGLLEITTGDPVLIVQRVFFGIDGIPIQATVNTFRNDRFRHHVRLYWTALDRKKQRIGTF